MCDGCGCSIELEKAFEVNRDEVAYEPTTSFLMVVTEVDEDLQVVSLSSVHDGEPPATMEWHYGLAPIETMSLDDKVGECYRVTLRKLP